ncbi:MAG TPA: type II toxin-antitoxin system prevent-host-death family antitoxin [Polyangiaceae bacterium]
MKRMSVAEAKAHFSELVADARRGKKTVILRHGRPAAAVVPATAVESAPTRRATTRDEALAIFESFAHLGDPNIDAVAELRAGRR